jgi:hypothetical protein
VLAIATRLGGAGANPFDPGFDIDLWEKGFERYQSLCNMKYDRGWLWLWNGRRWRHPTM